MKLQTLFLSLLLLVCMALGGVALGGFATGIYEHPIVSLFAPAEVHADTIQVYEGDGAINAGKPFRIKQIEFSCDSATPCYAVIRYGASATAPNGFPLQVTAGGYRVYDFWRLNQESQYVRQRGLLMPESFYDEVSGGTHAVIVVDKP